MAIPISTRQGRAMDGTPTRLPLLKSRRTRHTMNPLTALG